MRRAAPSLWAAGLAALALATAGSALALDPGVASGHYAGDGTKLAFTHAVALNQDDAEGFLDHGPQVRVLLSQEDVPVAALYGIAFPPVRQMARTGAVHGVLLEFSPKDKTVLQVTVLAQSGEAGAFMHSLSLSRNTGLWKTLTASDTRVAGDYDGAGEPDLAFSFSAPVFTDAVVSDLKGPEAVASEPVKLLITRAQLLAKGDLAGAKAISAKGSQIQDISPEMLKMASSQIAGVLKQYRAAKRVVIRHETAAVVLDAHSWASLIREDGVWKVAD
jgi:hypothetical protein